MTLKAQDITEARETVCCELALTQTVCVCVCLRHQGYAGAQFNLESHWQTYCNNETPVSQRASVRDGVNEQNEGWGWEDGS